MTNKGFTILESLFAISVVSLAIAGATLAVRGGLIASSVSKEQVKAFYLAQEAIEILRNKRDANILNKIINGASVTWLTGIANGGDPCATGQICRADATTNTLTACTAGWDSCPYLKYNTANSTYNYTTGNDSIFSREIMIEPSLTNIGNEVSVTIRVKWKHGVLNREFKTKTILTNWAI